MGQYGECYIVVNKPNKPKNVEKWEEIVKMEKVEKPPFGDSENTKLLSSIKVQLIRMDDPNIVLYVQEFDKVKT